MKALIIGDSYINSKDMRSGFEAWEARGVELVDYQWDQNGHDMSYINLLLEQNGPEAVDVCDELLELAGDADVIITQFCPINKKFVDAAKKCVAVGTLRAGLENIAVDYMTEKGIMVFNNAGRNAEAVADFTIGMMIAEYRNIARSHAAVKAGYWRKDYVNISYLPDFAGLTTGIVGFGMVGQLVAKKLSGFDQRLLAYDAYPDYEAAKQLNVEFVDLDTLMKECDIISVNARLVPETYHMIGARELSLMKPTAIIVNTARSGLIDEGALYEVLKDRKIGGAALDVFDKEPTSIDYRMITLDNCTVTSHLAGTTVHAMTRSALRLANHMANLFDGVAPKTWINRGKVELKKLVP
ncbi:MAG: 2-hydroxyacid dehydrogenase [Christensenellales bacterium]|jgi:D-3-phosphoglycerate dehydrogenase